MCENLNRPSPSVSTFIFLAFLTDLISVQISAAAGQLVLEVKQDPGSLFLSPPAVGPLQAHPLPLTVFSS